MFQHPEPSTIFNFQMTLFYLQENFVLVRLEITVCEVWVLRTTSGRVKGVKFLKHISILVLHTIKFGQSHKRCFLFLVSPQYIMVARHLERLRLTHATTVGTRLLEISRSCTSVRSAQSDSNLAQNGGKCRALRFSAV